MIKISIVPKILRMWGFLAKILHFATKIFRQEENFPTIFDSPKFKVRAEGNCTIARVAIDLLPSSATTPVVTDRRQTDTSYHKRDR